LPPAKAQRRQVIISVASSIFIRLWRTPRNDRLLGGVKGGNCEVVAETAKENQKLKVKIEEPLRGLILSNHRQHEQKEGRKCFSLSYFAVKMVR